MRNPLIPWHFSDAPEPPWPRPHGDQPEPSPSDCPHCSRIWRQLDVGSQRLTAVERDNQDLRQELLQAVARVDRLERRFAAMLAAQIRQRGDLPSNAHAEHEIIARDYQTLVEHRLAALARTSVRISPRGPAYQPAHLWYLGELTQALFQEPPVAGQIEAALHLDEAGRNALATPIERVLAEAKALWQRAERTGLPFRWDFDLLPGTELDPGRQAAWLSCDPCLPVQYVIAPAYIVERQVFGLQRVLTGPSL